MWRVLIVEDDPQMRDFFATSVTRCPDLELAASLGTVADALAWLDANGSTLDVMLTDLGLPDGTGLDLIRHATRVNPACESLVVSMFGDEDNVLASIEAGALGYIHKDSTPEDISQAILDMRAGASPISPMIARRVLSKYRVDKLNRTQELVDKASEAINSEAIEGPKVAESRGILSPREKEVLDLIARGFSYAEIARLQGLSVHTVQTHIKSLYGKLSVHSKSEAVYEATRMGLMAHPN